MVHIVPFNGANLSPWCTSVTMVTDGAHPSVIMVHRPSPWCTAHKIRHLPFICCHSLTFYRFGYSINDFSVFARKTEKDLVSLVQKRKRLKMLFSKSNCVHELREEKIGSKNGVQQRNKQWFIIWIDWAWRQHFPGGSWAHFPAGN